MKSVFLILGLFSVLACGQVSFSEYYEVLESDSPDKMSEVLKKFGAPQDGVQNARKGALMMKKSQFYRVPKDKLDLFKKGRLKLESEIEKDHNNVEYRFLRLAVQENCPKILKYNDNIQEDKTIIIAKFYKASKELQNVILDYAKTSTVISPEDFER